MVPCPCRLTQQSCAAPLETWIQLDQGHGRAIAREEVRPGEGWATLGWAQIRFLDHASVGAAILLRQVAFSDDDSGHAFVELMFKERPSGLLGRALDGATDKSMLLARAVLSNPS